LDKTTIGETFREDCGRYVERRWHGLWCWTVFANCARVENAHLSQIELLEVLTIPYNLTTPCYLLELLTIL